MALMRLLLLDLGKVTVRYSPITEPWSIQAQSYTTSSVSCALHHDVNMGLDAIPPSAP